MVGRPAGSAPPKPLPVSPWVTRREVALSSPHTAVLSPPSPAQRLGEGHPLSRGPGRRMSSQAHLYLLLMVVDLPGDLHVHGTPPPRLLRQGGRRAQL